MTFILKITSLSLVQGSSKITSNPSESMIHVDFLGGLSFGSTSGLNQLTNIIPIYVLAPLHFSDPIHGPLLTPQPVPAFRCPAASIVPHYIFHTPDCVQCAPGSDIHPISGVLAGHAFDSGLWRLFFRFILDAASKSNSAILRLLSSPAVIHVDQWIPRSHCFYRFSTS
jgi:hypothetical protein